MTAVEKNCHSHSQETGDRLHLLEVMAKKSEIKGENQQVLTIIKMRLAQTLKPHRKI